MRKELIEVYTIKELPPDIQSKVIEKYCYINVDDNNYWNEHLIEHWQEKLAALGYENAKVLFSGFSSQGDGACFTAQINIEMWLKAHKLESKNRALLNAHRHGEIGAELKHYGHYYHEHSTSLNLEDHTGNDIAVEELAAIEVAIMAEVVSLNKQIYKELFKEWEYQTSKEQIMETLEANNFEFTKDGKVFHK